MRDRVGTKWDRAARYMKLATILHAHRETGIRVEEIARQIGVSKRTVYRDLEAMDRDAGVPIWENGGRYGLEEGAFLPPLNLTLHEAMALFLAARVLLKTNDEGDAELIGALVKLAQILPPVLAEHIHVAVDAFARTPTNDRFTHVFRVLTEAWANRRIVTIDYDAGVYDATRGRRRTSVRPYLIEPSALTHALYLVGYDEERRARRTFKVERILDASLTPDTFEPEPGALPDGELSGAWDVIADQPLETVVVHFSARVARRVAETRWHPSQQIEQRPDGSLVWRGRVAGLHEIRIWILGWGADAEVLEPASLRADVYNELRAAADRYREGRPEAPARCPVGHASREARTP
jgi:predicted DNA-binding transcriptional regulator YafY